MLKYITIKYIDKISMYASYDKINIYYTNMIK